jgi:type I restriction enzyme S subunit
MRWAEAPRSWRSFALKRLFQIVNGSTPKSDEPAYWDGDIPWVTPDDLGALKAPELTSTQRLITQEGYRSCGTTLVPVSSLIVSTRAPIGYVAIATTPLCTNQGCKCLVPRGDVSTRFFYYQLVAAQKELVSQGQGSTFSELATTKLGAISLLLPPRREQDGIAAALDRETARIDALIAKKERLIDLLEARLGGLTARAVTQGIDDGMATKPSELAWLGPIPDVWTVVKLKRACSLLRDGTHQPPARVASGFPLLSVRNVIDGRLSRLPDDSMITEEDFRDLERSFSIRTGDVLLAIVGATLGKVAVVEVMEPFTIQRSLALLRPRSEMLSPGFLALLLRSSPMQDLLWRSVGYSAQPGIYLGTLGEIGVPLPPIAEQGRIVEFLVRETESTDRLVTRIRTAIALLREYRTALISAAVTGQIDVSAEAAGDAGRRKGA